MASGAGFPEWNGLLRKAGENSDDNLSLAHVSEEKTMTAKLTRAQRDTIADLDHKISALNHEFSKGNGAIENAQAAQLSQVRRRFTDQVKPINERKQKELNKLRSLRENELKAVDQRFDNLVVDLHKEFSGEFQKLEADYTKAETEVSSKFSAQLTSRESIFQAKLHELQAPRDDIMQKAEKAEKREEEERAKREAEAKAKKEAAAVASAAPVATPETPKPTVSTPA
jgi:peptidoglycan hydrolase CwlO-like protein